MRKYFSDGLRKYMALSGVFLLSACTLVQFRPLQTIQHIDKEQGYRLEKALSRRAQDDTFMILMFSGGGTRAAALGYGVLEALKKQPVRVSGKATNLMDNVDMVYGVSGGSVLAAYFSLYGAETVPSFEHLFLKQNFQKQFAKQVFSLANLPRLTSSEYGRGDLLQEQFENTLFKKTTFGDLDQRRKGPFAVISATDMAAGSRVDFTQEFFDMMCLNLSQLRIARAVAASSAVPLVFSPITLNNNGGNCGYVIPKQVKQAEQENSERHQYETHREFTRDLQQYSDSRKRPYIHLLDGGLTDNLGLRSLLDVADSRTSSMLQQQMANEHIRKIIIINVNAQNQIKKNIDESAAIPGVADVVSAVVDIPIDKYSQESLRRFRAYVDEWNESIGDEGRSNRAGIYFVSLNLRDLPESPLRTNVLNIPTTFYLPSEDINYLKKAARTLLAQSSEYQRLLRDLSAAPEVEAEINVSDKKQLDKPAELIDFISPEDYQAVSEGQVSD